MPLLAAGGRVPWLLNCLLLLLLLLTLVRCDTAHSKAEQAPLSGPSRQQRLYEFVVGVSEIDCESIESILVWLV